MKELIILTLINFHKKNPLKRGITKTDLKVLINTKIDILLFNILINDLVKENKILVTEKRVAIATHQVKVNEQQQETMDKIA